MASTPPAQRGRSLLTASAQAVRLLRRSDSRSFWTLTIAMAVSGLLVGPRLIGVRDLLTVMTGPDARAAAFVVPLLLVGVPTILIEAAASLRPHLERLLDAAATRTAQQTILEVTAGADFAEFDDPAFHDALDRATRGAELRPVQVVQGLTALVSAGVGAVTLLVAVIASSPVVALLLVVGYLPALLIQLQAGAGYYGVHHRNTQPDRLRAYLVRLLTTRSAVAELRFHGADRHLADRVASSWAARLVEVRQTARTHVRRTVAGVLLGSIATALGAVVLVWLFLTGRISVATAGVLVVATWELGAGLAALGWGVSNLMESSLFLNDWVRFAAPELLTRWMRERPATLDRDTSDELPLPTVARPIELRGVGFTYPSAEAPTLYDVDLRVAPGEVVALVGPSGAGKTTVGKLLAGLYAPTIGSYVWGGRVVGERQRALALQQISVMPQDFGRYAFSVRENLALADLDRAGDDAALEASARTAGIADVVRALPQGWDTQLGVEFDGGVDLSVGQWQRLALARSLFADSSLLILDEPTSALDPDTERAFVGELRELRRNRAVVIISHRFSTVSQADRIYVVDGGRVVEQGDHATLVRSGGLYARMFGHDGRDVQPIER